MEIHVTEMPELRIGGVRHVGPYHQIRHAFEKLGAVAGRAGLFGREGVTMLGVYYDNPLETPAEVLRSDAALTFPDGLPVPDGLSEHTLPKGRFLKAIHRGSYENLPQTWDAAFEAVTSNGHRMRNAANYEMYVNSPGEVGAEDLITEVYIPIE